MIEKFLGMLGINPEMFQAQMERVTAEAKAVVQHFDRRTAEIAEMQQHVALTLATVAENQRLIFEQNAAMMAYLGMNNAAHPVNGNHVLEHNAGISADERETVQ